MGEIRKARERGDTIVFVAAFTGRAERTIELLADYDVFAVPVERAEDSRTASVMVAVGHLSRGFRLPERRCSSGPRPDVFEEERKAHERRRSATRTSSPTSAISRSAISSSMSITGSACSSA